MNLKAFGGSHGHRLHPRISLPPTPPPPALPRRTGKKLLELFQKTPLGSFLAQLTVDQRQELLQCYLKDFLLLTMRVSLGSS